jgi:hypothetical protein
VGRRGGVPAVLIRRGDPGLYLLERVYVGTCRQVSGGPVVDRATVREITYRDGEPVGWRNWRAIVVSVRADGRGAVVLGRRGHPTTKGLRLPRLLTRMRG